MLKFQPCCCGDNINAPRSDPYLEDSSIFLQVFFGKILQWCPETMQCSEDGFCVIRGWHNPDVDIHRSSGISVRSKRISSDKDKLNLFVG